MSLISDSFSQRAYQIFNPRNAMYINRSDGLFNKAIMVHRDTVINANTLESLSRDSYTSEELAKMERLYKKNKFDKLLKSF